MVVVVVVVADVAVKGFIVGISVVVVAVVMGSLVVVVVEVVLGLVVEVVLEVGSVFSLVTSFSSFLDFCVFEVILFAL